MTEHRPIRPGEGKDVDRSSLLERASGTFGLGGFGAAPMPKSFDDVPMKRAKVLNRQAETKPAPAQTPVQDAPGQAVVEEPIETALPEIDVETQNTLPVPSAEPALPSVIEGTARAVALEGERHAVDRTKLRELGYIVPGTPAGTLAEEFRIVKRQLLDAARKGPNSLARRILVTSPHQDEGKTFCALNLALSFAAEREIEVVLIDGDLANPSIAETLGLPKSAGLMGALADPENAVERYALGTDIDGLWVIPPGRQGAEAAEDLASRRMVELFARLTADAPGRIVLVDSPPALAASHAAELAKHVGQTVMVAKADRTGKRALEDACQLLAACPDIKLLLNSANFSPSGRRFGSYYE